MRSVVDMELPLKSAPDNAYLEITPVTMRVAAPVNDAVFSNTHAAIDDVAL